MLGLLLLNPARRYHVREIARLTRTVAGTIHKELKKLAEVGILSASRQDNWLLYAANTDCPIYEVLVGIRRKTSGIAEVLAEALLPLSDRIEAAFILGSVPRTRCSPSVSSTWISTNLAAEPKNLY